MSRRELVERAALGAGAVICLAARARGSGSSRSTSREAAMRSSQGDVQYRVTPGKTGLWRASTLVPYDLAVTLIGTKDDVELRRAVRAVRLARLDDPERVRLRSGGRAAAQRRPGATRRHRRGRRRRRRRSRVQRGCSACIGLARLVSETQDRVALLGATVANLQLAIALDPTNDEAKYNLELALQRSRGIQLTEGAGGQNPSPGGSGSSGAGAGDPGSGY